MMKQNAKVLAGILMLSLTFVGCAAADAPSSSQSASASEPSASAPEASASVSEASASQPAADAPAPFQKEENGLSLSVELDRSVYDLNSLIQTKVTVTNTGDTAMVYVQGSGSNVVPDALIFELGGFAGLFHPEAVTMDYRIERLEPGQSLSYDCSFAPYLPKDDKTAFGTDKDLSFFQTDDFTPATPGEIAGSVEFTAYPEPANADPNTTVDISQLTPSIVKTDLTLTIQ